MTASERDLFRSSVLCSDLKISEKSHFAQYHESELRCLIRDGESFAIFFLWRRRTVSFCSLSKCVSLYFCAACGAHLYLQCRTYHPNCKKYAEFANLHMWMVRIAEYLAIFIVEDGLELRTRSTWAQEVEDLILDSHYSGIAVDRRLSTL